MSRPTALVTCRVDEGMIIPSILSHNTCHYPHPLQRERRGRRKNEMHRLFGERAPTAASEVSLAPEVTLNARTERQRKDVARYSLVSSASPSPSSSAPVARTLWERLTTCPSNTASNQTHARPTDTG